MQVFDALFRERASHSKGDSRRRRRRQGLAHPVVADIRIFNDTGPSEILAAWRSREGRPRASPTVTESYRSPRARLAGLHAPGPFNYFAVAAGTGKFEFHMSHWIFHVSFDFFDTFIHLPWSTCLPSAPRISYVPVP